MTKGYIVADLCEPIQEGDVGHRAGEQLSLYDNARTIKTCQALAPTGLGML